MRVLVVGGGYIGQLHASVYREMMGVTVVGIVDVNFEHTDDENKTILPNYKTIEQAVNDLGHIDVIDICLPTYMHKEYIIEAAKYCANIISEAPLARNVVEAKTIINYCEQNDIRLFVGHNSRFSPEYVKAKELIESGDIGEVCVVRTSRNGPFPSSWNDWYASFNNSGGVILETLSHDFDYLSSLFGKVKRVYAKGLAGRGFYRKDYALVALRFESGIIAHVEGSWAHHKAVTMLDISGTEGVIEYNSLLDTPLLKQTAVEDSDTTNSYQVEDRQLKEIHRRKLKYFFDGMKEKSRSPIDGHNAALNSLEITTAALQSMKTNKLIKLT